MFVYKAIRISHIPDVQMSNIILKMNLKKNHMIFNVQKCLSAESGQIRYVMKEWFVLNAGNTSG